MRKTTVIPAAALLISAAIASAQDTAISGFVDAAYVYDTAAANGEFGADQVEIDIDHRTGETSSLRADLEWLKDGEGYAAQVEQAYMTVSPAEGWALNFGKFNAPIGLELLDPPDMYQYSHALVFDHGLPTNLTGASVARDLGRNMDLVVHVSNGWDRATAGPNVTWGSRLGCARGGFTGGISAISGREPTRPVDPGDPVTLFTRTVLDVDLSYETGPWFLGGEFNRGRVDLPAGAEADWLGFLLKTHVALGERTGLTARYDYFDDPDGFVFGGVGGLFQTRQAIAVAPTYALDDGFGVLVELRIDLSDRDAFVDGDGKPTDTSTVLAFEATYGW